MSLASAAEKARQERDSLKNELDETREQTKLTIMKRANAIQSSIEVRKETNAAMKLIEELTEKQDKTISVSG